MLTLTLVAIVVIFIAGALIKSFPHISKAGSEMMKDGGVEIWLAWTVFAVLQHVIHVVLVFAWLVCAKQVWVLGGDWQEVSSFVVISIFSGLATWRFFQKPLKIYISR